MNMLRVPLTQIQAQVLPASGTSEQTSVPWLHPHLLRPYCLQAVPGPGQAPSCLGLLLFPLLRTPGFLSAGFTTLGLHSNIITSVRPSLNCKTSITRPAPPGIPNLLLHCFSLSDIPLKIQAIQTPLLTLTGLTQLIAAYINMILPSAHMH